MATPSLIPLLSDPRGTGRYQMIGGSLVLATGGFYNLQVDGNMTFTSLPNAAAFALTRITYSSGSLTFSAAASLAYEITLNATCSPTITNLAPGQLLRITVKQNGAGLHAFIWPANVINPPVVARGALQQTTQRFACGYAPGTTTLYLYPVGETTVN